MQESWDVEGQIIKSRDQLEAENERLKARDAETIAALERAGFAAPGLSPAENIAVMGNELGDVKLECVCLKAKIEHLQINLQKALVRSKDLILT
jgi:hypothetical protein